MKLYYKGKIEEVEETDGALLVRRSFFIDKNYRNWLIETVFSKHLENGELVWKWKYTTRKDWDKMVLESQRRNLKWIWSK